MKDLTSKINMGQVREYHPENTSPSDQIPIDDPFGILMPEEQLAMKEQMEKELMVEEGEVILIDPRFVLKNGLPAITMKTVKAPNGMIIVAAIINVPLGAYQKTGEKVDIHESTDGYAI